MSKNIYFLNHTSLVLEWDKYFLLLDPWPSDSLSFDSWKPHPPSFLNNDLLAAFINVSGERAGIVISHAHDDHCDDVFLKKVSSSTAIYFPNYKSKGGLKRLSGDGLENITEINKLEYTSFGPFSLATYIIEEHSEDDAVFIIKTDEYIFIHANDNSVKFPKELIDFINQDVGSRKIYFASQTGIANGYPYCYPQFLDDKNKEEISNIVIKKTKNTIQIAVDNANLLGADHFITYAAYTISMPLLKKYNGEISQFFPSPKNLKKLELIWGQLNLLDFVPGDTLDLKTDEVIRPFWLKENSIEELADELKEQRLRDVKSFSELSTYKINQFPEVNTEELMGYVKHYLNGFYTFVLKLDDFWKDEILNKLLEIKIESVGLVTLNLKDGSILYGSSGNQPNKKITIDRETCLLLMCGFYNFESLYIGHHALFERYPLERFNHELMMQLQVYGYVYQKRLVPEELK